MDFIGVYFLMTGYLPIKFMEFPSIGAVVAKELPPHKGMPSCVLNAMLDHAMGPGVLGSAYAPFRVRSDPNAPDFRVDDLELPVDVYWKTIADRRWLVKQMDQAFRDRDSKGITAARDNFYLEAERIMRSPEVKKAVDIWAEPEARRERYGRTPIGQGCLLARGLVESGVRFVTVNASRAIWDTHADNFNRLQKALLPEFDMAYSALLQDLSERGLLSSTLVVVSGEFGRTPKINAAGGRDHWPRVFSVLLAGAGVKGGQVYGSSDAKGGQAYVHRMRLARSPRTTRPRLKT